MTPRKAKNTNRQGANYELQIMAHLKERGYDVLRSSGSRGKIDVVAIGDGLTLGIQAKISNPLLSPADRIAVTETAWRADWLPLVSYRIRGQVCFRLLTGTGPKDWHPFEAEICKAAPCVCGHPNRMHMERWGCGESVSPDRDCMCPSFRFPPKTPKTKGTAS